MVNHYAATFSLVSSPLCSILSNVTLIVPVLETYSVHHFTTRIYLIPHEWLVSFPFQNHYLIFTVVMFLLALR